MKRTPLIVLIAAGGLVALGGWYAWSHREQKAPVAEARAPANHVLLAADAPQRAFLKLEEAAEAPLPAAGPFNARLVSADDLTSRIFTPVNGRLVKIMVSVGDTVHKGMPLAMLDSPDFASAVADLRKAEADAAVKERALQRVESLAKDEALSQRDLEGAQGDARSSKAELERARARFNNLSNLGIASNDKVTDTGDGRSFILRSPMDGVIVDRQANPGTEIRNDAANPAFVIATLGKLALLVDLPEKDALAVRPGDTVSFNTDASPTDGFSATVERVAPAVDPVTRRITVRATVDNKAGQLRPEMYARASLLEKNGGKGLRVPVSALLTAGLNTTVFIESKPGDLERRAVKLLRQDRDFAYLANGEGIKRGDKVVIKGAMLLASELASSE
ncbi:MAG TPA: efflux RND transporter periplasmic adaptor subunit [Rhodocyclaceae bacterium]|nr:efflux RND transporter periplasmic adaptor subunit [Rhodocyclaceae bacterium]